MITITQIKGKAIKQPAINLLTKLNQEYRVDVSSPDAKTLAMELTQFVRSCNTGFMGVSYHGKKVTVQLFDRTRYLILDLDRETYSRFVD